MAWTWSQQNQTEKQKLMVNQILDRKVIRFLAQKSIKNHRLIAENILIKHHQHEPLVILISIQTKAVIFYVHQRNQQLDTKKHMFNHHPIAKDLPENTHTHK